MNSVKAALGVVSTVLGALGVVKIIIIPTLRPFRLWSLYGVPGIFLFLFGSQTTWSVEAQVLGRLGEDDALQFKKSVQDECTMVSVAVSTYSCDMIVSDLRLFLMLYRLLSSHR